MKSSYEERFAEGRELRTTVPRSAHSGWSPRPPVARQPFESALDCFRSSAGVMAADLAGTPRTGILVQACGDCHLLNFSGYATPERYLVFDFVDFDETLRAPWEWDVKRLAASIVLAARQRKLPKAAAARAAEMLVRSYRERIREYAQLPALELWHKKLTGKDLIDRAPAATRQAAEGGMPRFTDPARGEPRFVEDAPRRVRLKGTMAREEMQAIFDAYRENLAEDQRSLVERYRLADVARQGTGAARRFLLLMVGPRDDVVVLQMRQARASVLEAHAGASPYQNHGERVVAGQKLIQAAGDEFLGWVRDKRGHDHYVRQVRELKLVPSLEGIEATGLTGYGTLTAMVLARTHARTGDAAGIAGYLGSKDVFDQAVARFALEYADQAERDYEAPIKSRTG